MQSDKKRPLTAEEKKAWRKIVFMEDRSIKPNNEGKLTTKFKQLFKRNKWKGNLPMMVDSLFIYVKVFRLFQFWR